MGAFYALLAFLFWGLSPIFWKLISHIPAEELLAQRIFWSGIFLFILLSLQRRWQEVKDVLVDKSQRKFMLVSAALISINWFVYIYAVNNNNILEASLGYYMNPLVNVFLGIVFLGERQNLIQSLCLILAAIGVGIMVGAFGKVPYIALLLAGSFGLYGLVRKKAPVHSIPGLFIEVLFIYPFILLYLGNLAFDPSRELIKVSSTDNILLVATGMVTILPLIWFASAVRRLSLTVTGLFQYIAPTGQFLLAVFLYGEVFTQIHAITFSCIWVALIIYTIDNFRNRKKTAPVVAPTASASKN